MHFWTTYEKTSCAPQQQLFMLGGAKGVRGPEKKKAVVVGMGPWGFPVGAMEVEALRRPSWEWGHGGMQRDAKEVGALRGLSCA